MLLIVFDVIIKLQRRQGEWLLKKVIFKCMSLYRRKLLILLIRMPRLIYVQGVNKYLISSINIIKKRGMTNVYIFNGKRVAPIYC